MSIVRALPARLERSANSICPTLLIRNCGGFPLHKSQDKGMPILRTIKAIEYERIFIIHHQIVQQPIKDNKRYGDNQHSERERGQSLQQFKR